MIGWELIKQPFQVYFYEWLESLKSVSLPLPQFSMSLILSLKRTQMSGSMMVWCYFEVFGTLLVMFNFYDFSFLLQRQPMHWFYPVAIIRHTSYLYWMAKFRYRTVGVSASVASTWKASYREYYSWNIPDTSHT